MNLSRENNFDLIRLFAALQVVFWHSTEHLHFQEGSSNSLTSFLQFFPGVTIFFTISGFLIYSSFDKNKDLKIYLRNRFLRIYPALWVCLMFTIILLSAFGFINSLNVLSSKFIFWIISQSSFLQFYTPDFFRDFGNGSPNGSLWTIPVEVSFYIFIIFIFWLVRKIKLPQNYIICSLMITSYLFNYWYSANFKTNETQSNLIKLLGLNLIPYLFYFLLGSLAYVNWERIRKWYEGKGFYWIVFYMAYFFIFSIWLKKFSPTYWPNLYGLVSIIILSQATLALAYSKKKLSRKLLRGNDISYGIYLYHMPIINTILQLGYKGYNYSFAVVFFLTTLIAFLSWKFIEKPILLLKRKASIREN
ncbi:MAG: acyltransferase [Ferruginibacter sp.]